MISMPDKLRTVAHDPPGTELREFDLLVGHV